MQKVFGIIASLCLILTVNATTYDLEMSAPIDVNNEWLNPDVAPPWLVEPEPGKTQEGTDLTVWNTTLPVYPGPNVYRGMSCVDDSGFFYAIGGQSAIIANMYRYDPYGDTWQTMPSMPGVCSNQFAAFWKYTGTGTDSSCIFVTGRYSPTYAKTCYRWTKATNTWDTIPQYPGTAYTGNMCGVIGDTLYLVSRSTSTTTLLYRYAIRQGTWDTGPTPPSNTNYYGTACTYGGKFYQLGGWINSQTFQVYTPGSGWTLLTSPPANIGGNSGQIAGHNGKIFAWGGGNGWTPWNGYAIYDTVSGTWTPEANLPAACGYTFFGAVLDGGSWYLHSAAGYKPTVGNTHWRGLWILPAATDVGMQSILYPSGPTLGPNITFQPSGEVKNFGTGAMTNIPVHCLIDSSGTQIYHDSVTIASMGAGALDTVNFASFTSGATGAQYVFTMYTAALIDSQPANDTLSISTLVIPWIDIAAPANTPDRLTHATTYNPVTDKIYMIGGTPNGQTGSNVNLCQEYDPTTNTWTDKATMPTALGWISGACVQGNIYVVGGYNNSAAVVNTNYRFDPVANAWTTRAPRPRLAACDLGGVVWRDSLVYTLGGTNLSIGWTFVDVYNPFFNTWQLGTPLPLPGDMGGACIIGDTIYIPNALNRGASSCWPNLVKGAIDPANPTNITWVTGPAHSYPTFDAGVTALRGDPYWLGGFLYATSVTDMFWKYDRATNTIVNLENYPVTNTRCHYLAARASEPAIYVVAGDSGGNWAAPNRKYYKYVFPPFTDVGCTGLVIPATAAPGESIAPACSVYNYGDNAATFVVRMKIGTVYEETDTVTALATGTYEFLTFPNWAAVVGNHTVSCSTELAGDMVASNDRQTGTISVTTPSTDWEAMTDVPSAPSGKNPKSGSCMDGLEATGLIYFLKASNKPDFYSYDPATNAWNTLETIPKGEKGIDYSDGKYPKRGAAMCAYEPHKSVYVVRGNNRLGFWKYQADTLASGDTIGWSKKATIPAGAKRCKYGTALELVQKGGNDYFFLMKGAKTMEFYLYDPAGDSWTAVSSPPVGASGKSGYKKGSIAAYDGSEYVYVLQGYYGSFFKYHVESDSWTELRQYNYREMRNRDGKKKKFKDGASMVYYNGNCYCLKGGNTVEVWKYTVAADSWTQMPLNWDVPLGPTGRKKVKDGGGMIMFANYFWASKGKNTPEFYRHGLPAPTAMVSYLPTNEGAMGKKVNLGEFNLTIAPNPAVNVAAVRYNLPKAGPVTFKVYNVTGALVRSHTIAEPTKSGVYVVNELPAGVYILRFNAGDIRVSRKIVLER